MSKMNINVGVNNFIKGTNVLDVEVPPHLRERRKTGFDLFDVALGSDGLVPTSVTMVTGMPGMGKSTLLRQLADFATGQGYTCLYNSGEESVIQVKISCERMGLKNGFYVGQEELVPKLLAYADELRAKNPNTPFFLFQDSLQTLDDGKYLNGTNSTTSVRVTEMLVDWAKKTHSYVLFIGQCTKSGDYAGKSTIRHAIDVHAKLHIDLRKKSETYGCRFLEVTKNRWGVSGKQHMYDITDEGLKATGDEIDFTEFGIGEI